MPIRARTTVVELVFGCMLTGRGHVTQAISAITPRRGWRAYFRMIETGGFSWLDIVHALCRIVRDSFVRQDCCVMALDDTLLLRSSKKAPGAARRFDHAGKPNRPRHVLAQNLVSLSTVIGPPGRRRSLPLASRLSDDGLDGGKLTTAVARQSKPLVQRQSGIHPMVEQRLIGKLMSSPKPPEAGAQRARFYISLTVGHHNSRMQLTLDDTHRRQ